MPRGSVPIGRSWRTRPGWSPLVVSVASTVALVAMAVGCSGIDRSAVPAAPPTTSGSASSGPVPSGAVDVADPTFPGLGDPRIDVERYDVHLRTTPGVAAISGRVLLHGRVRARGPLRSFTLDLHALRVRSAVVDGAPATVRAAGDQITVTPARSLAPGAPFAADLAYGGEPEPLSLSAVGGLAVGWRHDRDGGTFTLSEPYGTRTWMPVSDHPSDKAVFTVSVDVPDGVQVVGNGRLQGRAPAGTPGRTVWTWGDPAPMASYLALVAVGHYDLVAQPGPDGIALLSAYPAGTGGVGRAAFEDVPAILSAFRDAFGPYPFRTAGVVVVPADLGVALETQTRPIYGREALGGGAPIAHELAHQWFGDGVSPNSWADIWLAEGFARYGEWVWTAASGGASIDALARAAHASLGATTTPVLGRSGRDAFGAVVYERGAVTLAALRATLGPATFRTLLHRWSSRYGGRSATTAQFVALAGEVAGRDLGPMLRAWLADRVVPPFPA